MRVWRLLNYSYFIYVIKNQIVYNYDEFENVVIRINFIYI